MAQLNHRLCVRTVEAIILRPHGFLGTAMVAIVRFVQNHAAAPWPVWEPNKNVAKDDNSNRSRTINYIL